MNQSARGGNYRSTGTKKKLQVAEMRMLRLSAGVSRLDRIRDEYVRGSLAITDIGVKVEKKVD